VEDRVELACSDMPNGPEGGRKTATKFVPVKFTLRENPEDSVLCRKLLARHFYSLVEYSNKE
jgi:hypothetical protein